MIKNVIVDKDITDWDVNCTPNNNYRKQYNINNERDLRKKLRAYSRTSNL